MVNLKKVFFRWVFLVALLIVGVVLVILTGVVEDIYRSDFTKLSFAIFFAFIILTIRTGILTFSICQDINRSEIIKKKNQAGWFFSDLFMAVGMVGTIIGFIAMMGVFSDFSTELIQQVVTAALSRMSVALYTTASGLICGSLLKVQLFNLEQYMDLDE